MIASVVERGPNAGAGLKGCSYIYAPAGQAGVPARGLCRRSCHRDVCAVGSGHLLFRGRPRAGTSDDLCRPRIHTGSRWMADARLRTGLLAPDECSDERLPLANGVARGRVGPGIALSSLVAHTTDSRSSQQAPTMRNAGSARRLLGSGWTAMTPGLPSWRAAVRPLSPLVGRAAV